MRKLLKTQLHNRNLIQGINSLSVSLVRYLGPFGKLSRELQRMDQKTRKLRINSIKSTHKILLDFEIQTDYLILTRRPDLVMVNKNKKRTRRIVDFAVPADHMVKLKLSETRYPDFTKKLKNLSNMIVMVTLIVIDDVGTVKWLVHGIEDLKIRGQVDTK